jgi:HEAT repeat protein
MPEWSETKVRAILAQRQAPIIEVQRAIGAVRDQRMRAAIPAVIEWLKDTDLTVVDSACEAIAAVRAREAIPDLLDLLRPEAEAERRIHCVVDPFGWYEPPPRESAAFALGEIGAQEAVPALLRLLADELPGPREAAATALGRLRATQAREAIARLLGDGELRVRDAAKDALRALRGQAPG